MAQAIYEYEILVSGRMNEHAVFTIEAKNQADARAEAIKAAHRDLLSPKPYFFKFTSYPQIASVTRGRITNMPEA